MVGENLTCKYKNSEGLCTQAIKPSGGMFKCNTFTHASLLKIMHDLPEKIQRKIREGGENKGFTS